MLQLKNTTPFRAQLAVLPDHRGVETAIVVVKATFELGSVLRLAEEQAAVALGDEWWGKPDASSLKYPSELHLPKPTTDVALLGSAQAPGRRPIRSLDVSVRVADVQKAVRVFGERVWTGRRFGASFTGPELFETMPLVYERSFGGLHVVDAQRGKVHFEPRNPVGCGFRGKRSLSEMKGVPLPNLEDPARSLRRPGSSASPAGFGFIALTWEPRIGHAGTYDETWRKTRAPFLPVDFDPRFFNAAHPDLVCTRHLVGGESVTATNVWCEGPLSFDLPVCEFDLSVSIRGETSHPPLFLETVTIEPDDSRLCMLWRATTPCEKAVLQVEQVELGLRRLTIAGRTA